MSYLLIKFYESNIENLAKIKISYYYLIKIYILLRFDLY